jgi:hypothetical protein
MSDTTLLKTPLKKLDAEDQGRAKEIRQAQGASQFGREASDKRESAKPWLLTCCYFSPSFSCFPSLFLPSLLNSVAMDPPHVAHCG